MSENENKKPDIKEDEKDLLLDYDFDGIKEFDNPPPPWLMYLFYATIFFSALYWVHMHAFKQGLHQDERYAKEVARAEAAIAKQKEKQKESSEVAEVKFLTSETDIQRGRELYVQMGCAACHGENLEGNAIGPNLTDQYWIHGNSIEDYIDIISNGNLQKGMTAFKDQMSEKEIIQVASYVHYKVGSKPDNAKEPQGEKYN